MNLYKREVGEIKISDIIFPLKLTSLIEGKVVKERFLDTICIR